MARRDLNKTHGAQVAPAIVQVTSHVGPPITELDVIAQVELELMQLWAYEAML